MQLAVRSFLDITALLGAAFYSGAPGTFDQSLCFAPKEISLLEMTQPLDPLIFCFPIVT